MKSVILLTVLCGIVASHAGDWKMVPDPAEIAANLKRWRETKRCPSCDLRGVNVSYENLSDSDINGANITNIIAVGTILNGSDVSWCIAVNATLTEAKIRSSNLIGTNLEQAQADGTDFEGSYLRLAKTKDMKTSDTTNFSRCKMRHIRDAQYQRCVEGIKSEDKSICNNNGTDIELIERLKSTTHAEN